MAAAAPIAKAPEAIVATAESLAKVPEAIVATPGPIIIEIHGESGSSALSFLDKDCDSFMLSEDDVNATIAA